MSRKIAREVAFKVVFETAFQEDEKISINGRINSKF